MKVINSNYDNNNNNNNNKNNNNDNDNNTPGILLSLIIVGICP